MRGPLVPLTGADCFLRAFDGEVRRTAGASHVSQLVLRLGPGFDPERLSAQVAQAVEEAPILCAPIRRPRGLGAPVYDLARAPRAPLPRVELHPAAAPAACGGLARPLPEAFFASLNGRLDARRGELHRVDVVP